MFFTPNGQKYNMADMILKMEEFIISAKSKDWNVKMIIGCDSQNRGDHWLFAVAVALHSIGHGGTFFIHRKKVHQKLHLSDRLFQEAALSLEIAEQIKGNKIVDLVDGIEIHADVGHNGKSSKYANAIKAMIEAYGYIGQIKPDAPIATHLADHYVR